MKRITTDDKIRWIFKYLVHRLNPVIIGSHKMICNTGWGLIKKQYTITYLDNSVDMANMPSEIEYPFTDIIVYFTEKHICILGSDLYYKFPSHFLLTLQQRFNK